MHSLLVLILFVSVVVVVVNCRIVNFDPNHDLLKFMSQDKGYNVKSCPNCNPVAGPCDSKCKPNKCRCSSENIPGNLTRSQVPQMVIITVQNAVHDHNVNIYLDLFRGRKNPGSNKCPAVGTFYVSSEWTSPYDVQLLAHHGHEIGMNGAKDLGWPWWNQASVADWCQQIEDNREILSHWSNLKASDIRGFRSPNLLMRGDTQFLAYQKCGVSYDATRVSLNYPKQPNLMYPYTYDNRSTQDCPIGICPNMSFPGIWQMPLQALTDNRGVPCSALGGCNATNESEMFNILKTGFDDRYNGNHSPIMVSVDEAFLRLDYKFNAMSRFLDYVASKQGYIVSASQAIEWMKNPVSTSCRCNPIPCGGATAPLCDKPVTCSYDRDNKFVPRGAPGGSYVMDICATSCPACYPRFGDPYGTKC